jgi:tripartite-type tricarboxylate transporter receptor subunit TctC
MRMSRCCIIKLLLLPFLLCQFAGPSLAQGYPSKPVRIIIPTAPGDGCDLLSRLVALKLGERLRWQFTIDNRPGAAQQLGLQLLAQSPPDGYTIGCGQSGNMVLVPHTYKKVPYDTFKDFAPVALLGSNFLAVVVHPTVPFKNIKDLVAYGKANPGKLTFGNTGEGAFLHFATELLSREAGFTYLNVPFKSTTALITDIIGGRIDAMVGPFNTIQPYAAQGRLKLLGLARATRAPNYPDIPTIAESVPGYTSGGWFGLVAPAAVPKEIVTLLNREVGNVMRLPDVREKTAGLELEVHAEPPEFFADVIRKDYAKWGKVAKDIGYKPQ